MFVGDHGVALPKEQGGEACSAFPSTVTPSIAKAMAQGGAAGAVLARSVGMEVRVIDVGMAVDVDFPGLLVDKTARGTRNFTLQPAMTGEECAAAVGAGRRAVQALAHAHALSLGEIGIGNTTAAAALVAAFARAPPRLCVGKGTGLDPAGVARKAGIVEAGLERHREVLAHVGPSMHPDPDTRRTHAFAAVAAVGGLELAALVGAILEAGERGIGVLVDGFIASAAALAAIRADPSVGRVLFLSTLSAEAGHRLALQALSHELPQPLPPPALDMGLALGEGTGGVLSFPVLRGAAALASHMLSLPDALAL